MTEAGPPFQTIVIAVDGSPASAGLIGWTEALAPHDATIYLLRVLEIGSTSRERTAAHMEVEKLGASGQTPHPGHRRRVLIREGEPPLTILDVASETGSQLIAMASAGQGALRRLAFGSVADSVSRSSPVPVLIVRNDIAANGDPSGPERVVVPLDGSEAANMALSVAVQLASQLDVSLTLLTVVDPSLSASAATNYASAFSQDLYEELAAAARTDADRMLQAVVKSLPAQGIPVITVVADGSAGQAIVAQAERSDLVVMTSHGRGGLQRLMIGSTAEHVLRHGKSPVLLIRRQPL